MSEFETYIRHDNVLLGGRRRLHLFAVEGYDEKDLQGFRVHHLSLGFITDSLLLCKAPSNCNLTSLVFLDSSIGFSLDHLDSL